MQAVYEADFAGFSYGFRPKRSQHMALDALSVGIQSKKAGWVLDADIRGFFDAIDHEWMMRLIEHRIQDQRVIRHIKTWLNAGVLENGIRHRAEEGTPQGASLSPLLANIYLHYVFDLWAQVWRKRHARGDVIIVRYADDIVIGFQYRSDAVRFQQELAERFARFRLELNPDKTRLLEFGRFAAANRKRRGEPKPETFTFLGFTHVCSTRRNGSFLVLRQTIKKRMRAKLHDLKEWLRTHLHDPVPVVVHYLRQVLRGHYQYYGVPFNGPALCSFRLAATRLWYHSLRRRSQKTNVTWERMARLATRYLPMPRILHPYPEQRLGVFIRGRSPVR